MDPSQMRPPGMPGVAGMPYYAIGAQQVQHGQQPTMPMGPNFSPMHMMPNNNALMQQQQQTGQAPVNLAQMFAAAAQHQQKVAGNPAGAALAMPPAATFAPVAQPMQQVPKVPQSPVVQAPSVQPMQSEPARPALGAARAVQPADKSAQVQHPFLLSATVSLLEHLDRKLMVILRDGRKFVGILRSFDQFANIVLQKTVERIWVGNKYAEKPLGVFLIRGENVVLVGEVDEPKEEALQAGTQRWQKLDLKTVQELEKQDREVRVEQLKMRRKLLLSRGLTSIGQSTGYSLFGGFGIDVFQDDTTI